MILSNGDQKGLLKVAHLPDTGQKDLLKVANLPDTSQKDLLKVAHLPDTCQKDLLKVAHLSDTCQASQLLQQNLFFADDRPLHPQTAQAHLMSPRAGPWQPAWMLKATWAKLSMPPSFIWGQGLGIRRKAIQHVFP